jgi:hypothetical protein
MASPFNTFKKSIRVAAKAFLEELTEDQLMEIEPVVEAGLDAFFDQLKESMDEFR